MKAVTEFASVTLSQALKSQAAMAAEGKSTEEVQQNLGQTYKLEGEKLTHFMHALEVAGKNTEGLKRVMIVSLSEGENAPAKAVKVDDFHYIPDFFVAATPKAAAGKGGPGGGRGAGGGRGGPGGGGPKSSPWGMSPEEIAAKKEKSIAAAKAAKS